MKQLRRFTALLMTAAFFAGCTKDNNNNLQRGGDGITYTENSELYPVAINYKLVLPQPNGGSLIQWNSGYLNTTEFVFNATHKNGNELTQQRFGTRAAYKIMFFDTKVLGDVYVPKTNCDYASFTVSLDTSNGNYAMRLYGIYNLYGTAIPPVGVMPVQLTINEPVDLNSVWINNVTTGMVSYWSAIIELSPDLLVNGIDQDMMNAAEVTDGMIKITSTSNKNLYQAIINNLQNHSMQVQCIPQLISTPHPSAF